jgi:hypothetical protein
VYPATSLRQAKAVAVIGSPTNAARYHRSGTRTILFAGDSQGLPEANQQADPEAYAFLRQQDGTRWVPCFAGGPWHTDARTASFTLTDDDRLLTGQPLYRWFHDRIGDTWGPRSLWCGPLLRFLYQDDWLGHSVASGAFLAAPTFHDDMVYGTRTLLSFVG